MLHMLIYWAEYIKNNTNALVVASKAFRLVVGVD
jgi:hypothetical protein